MGIVLVVILGFAVVFMSGMVMGQRLTLEKVKREITKYGIEITWGK